MARLTPKLDRVAKVRLVIERLGLDEIEASFAVALASGEIPGDVVSERPMTREERRRVGLDLIAGEDDLPEYDEEPDDETEQPALSNAYPSRHG